MVVSKYKNMLDEWKHHRFLKKHGCRTQREYDLKYDAGYQPRADRIKHIYHGYSYFYFVPDTNTHADYYEKVRILEAWCDENCKEMFRGDWHRGFYDRWQNDFVINEIGGGDVVVFAFKSEKDYLWFLLSCSDT